MRSCGGCMRSAGGDDICAAPWGHAGSQWAMTKKAGTTSPTVAKKASELLSDKKTSAKVKSVAAAALSNAANRKKPRGSK